MKGSENAKSKEQGSAEEILGFGETRKDERIRGKKKIASGQGFRPYAFSPEKAKAIKEKKKELKSQLPSQRHIKKRGGEYRGNDPIVVRCDEFEEFLHSLLGDFNYEEIAMLAKTTQRNARRVLKPDCVVGLRTVDKWLLNLGLEHVLAEHRLNLYRNPGWSKKRFDDFFIRNGDTPPSDVISLPAGFVALVTY